MLRPTAGAHERGAVAKVVKASSRPHQAQCRRLVAPAGGGRREGARGAAAGRRGTLQVRAEKKKGSSMGDVVLEKSLPVLSQAVQESVDRLSDLPGAGGPTPSTATLENRDDLEMDQGLCVAFRKYDPEAVTEYAMANKLQLAVRASKIAGAIGGFWVRRELIWKNKQAANAAEEAANVRQEAAYLRKILAELGPTFVKLGQNLANRPDLVRADYMDELCALQDKVPPFPNEIAMSLIRETLGDKPFDDVFKRLTPEPVAAASLGQVYKGVLKSNGATVAVKVLRPGVEPQVLLDLYLLRYVAENSLNEYALKNLGVKATLLVDEFGEKLLEELDYIQEGRNLADFRRNFASDPKVKIPYVYTEFSGAGALVMEWVDGVRCVDPDAFESEEAKQRFIRIGVESGMKQLLEHGLFHGDPHPGNVLALRNGDIGYVDFGNVAEISRMNQECLIDAVVHAMNDDYKGLAEDMRGLGFISPTTDVVPIAKALRETWAETLNENGLVNFSFRTLTDQFNKLLFLYPIRVPERFSLVIRALLTQEGICMTLDPNFQFLEVAFPYVARRLLTDNDPALRLRLLQVVIVDGKFEWSRLKYLMSLAGSDKMVDGPGLLSSLNLGEVISDGMRMLARDAQLRSELLKGFRSQPLSVHLAEAQGLLGVFLYSAAQEFVRKLGVWWRGLFVSLNANIDGFFRFWRNQRRKLTVRKAGGLQVQSA